MKNPTQEQIRAAFTEQYPEFNGADGALKLAKKGTAARPFQYQHANDTFQFFARCFTLAYSAGRTSMLNEVKTLIAAHEKGGNL